MTMDRCRRGLSPRSPRRWQLGFESCSSLDDHHGGWPRSPRQPAIAGWRCVPTVLTCTTCTNESIVETFAMSAETARLVVDRVRGVMPESAFGIETADGFGHERAYKARWEVDPLLAIGPIHDLLDRPVAKLLIRDESLDGDTMLQRARPVLLNLAEVTHSDVNDCLLEVSALGVSKASTLARLAASWGIGQDDVVAFGDMPNDVEMLRWAGTGYAMANAHPEVLAAVDNLRWNHPRRWRRRSVGVAAAPLVCFDPERRDAELASDLCG